MVVVAHPDDETFGCGSLLLHAAASGAETAVVCATRGEAGQPAPGSGVTVDQLGAVRERELRDAAQLLGVTRVELLDFADSGMSGAAGPHTLFGADVAAVRDQVRAHIEDFRPTVVVSLDGSDGHRDHARIGEATIAAVAGLPYVERLYLYCLPQDVMRQWLEYVARTNPTSEHLTSAVPGTPDELISTVIDTAQHLARREAAIAAHASQVSPFEGLPDELRVAFLTKDHLCRVMPLWSGDTREHDLF